MTVTSVTAYSRQLRLRTTSTGPQSHRSHIERYLLAVSFSSRQAASTKSNLIIAIQSSAIVTVCYYRRRTASNRSPSPCKCEDPNLGSGVPSHCHE